MAKKRVFSLGGSRFYSEKPKGIQYAKRTLAKFALYDAVKAISVPHGRSLNYGSRFIGPGRSDRVPRSSPRPLMTTRKVVMPRLFPAKPLLGLQVRRQPLVRPTLSSRKVGRFRFRSPFGSQYRQLLAFGRMVKNPKRVVFCVKRKLRREVLFAFRRVGFRGSSPGNRRKYRRNGNSLHGC